jgi:hypothetical protein
MHTALNGHPKALQEYFLLEKGDFSANPIRWWFFANWLDLCLAPC